MSLWMIISKVSHHRIFKITMGGRSSHESPQYLDSFSHLSPSLGDRTKISYKFASKKKNDELLLCKTGVTPLGHKKKSSERKKETLIAGT